MTAPAQRRYRAPVTALSTSSDFAAVGDTITTSASTHPSTLVSRLADNFFHQPNLDSVAVVVDNRPIGLITRQKFLFTVFRRFGWEVFGRKTVSELRARHRARDRRSVGSGTRWRTSTGRCHAGLSRGWRGSVKSGEIECVGPGPDSAARNCESPLIRLRPPSPRATGRRLSRFTRASARTASSTESERPSVNSRVFSPAPFQRGRRCRRRMRGVDSGD